VDHVFQCPGYVEVDRAFLASPVFVQSCVGGVNLRHGFPATLNSHGLPFGSLFAAGRPKRTSFFDVWHEQALRT